MEPHSSNNYREIAQIHKIIVSVERQISESSERLMDLREQINNGLNNDPKFRNNEKYLELIQNRALLLQERMKIFAEYTKLLKEFNMLIKK